MEWDRSVERNTVFHGYFGYRYVPTERHAADDLDRLTLSQCRLSDATQAIIDSGGVTTELIGPMTARGEDQRGSLQHVSLGPIARSTHITAPSNTHEQAGT
jgi:hypothetical protein